MAGLDHGTAGLAIREAFAPPPERRADILRRLRAAEGVLGCVLLSTCNRVELYLSHDDGRSPDGAILLCGALGLEAERHRRHFIGRRGRQAALHLMRVTGGMRSSVLGDDQILSQARSAIEEARRAGTSDPLTETLFRCAVAAGKKIKTGIGFAREGISVASEAVRRAETALGGLAGLRALVIGNGVVGRLAARELQARGCAVTMTRRRHNRDRKQAELPVAYVSYEERYAAMAESDLALSATSSPHVTIRLAEVVRLARLPRLFIDLAVPRDIEPELAGLSGLALWNVDDLRPEGDEGENRRRLARAEEVLAEEVERFEIWRRNRERRLPGRGGSPGFPVFINLQDADALVIGGGRVAARRVGVMLGFGAKVRVVAPELSPEMERHLVRDGVTWEKRGYAPEDLAGAVLAVAASDDREINRRAGLDARERGIPVSVADRREECSFCFPAIIQSDRLVAGLISREGGDHELVRRAAIRLREELEAFDASHKGGDEEKRTGAEAGRAYSRCD